MTCGAGVVGSSLTKNLADDGFEVTVLDSLARPARERDLEWLGCAAGPGLGVVAQVAVTSSVDDPRSDFEVNAFRPLNVLEATASSRRLEDGPRRKIGARGRMPSPAVTS